MLTPQRSLLEPQNVSMNLPRASEENTALLALRFRTLDLCMAKIMIVYIAVGIWKYYVQLAIYSKDTVVSDEHWMLCESYRHTSCSLGVCLCSCLVMSHSYLLEK